MIKEILVLITVSFFLELFLAGCETSNVTKPGDEPTILPVDQLQTALNTYTDTTDGVLGAMCGVDMAGYESWNGSSGYFDLSKTSRLKPADKFLVGSITKMFTATVVLQLMEEGLVDLDSFIINYLPVDLAAVLDSIPYGDQITVFQALCHRSGIYNFSRSWSLIQQVFADPSHAWTPIEILRLVKDEGEPDFIPGTAFNYSNTNYLLLGVLIEYLTQKSLATVFQERIFSKVGMHNSFLSEGVLGSNQPGIAHGYDEEFGRVYDGQEFHSGTSWAAGGMISATQDLNLFLRSLSTNKVFKNDSTFQQMINTGANEWYGLGIFVKEHPVAGPYFGHGGGVFGTNSTAFYFFDNNAIVTCCITLDGTKEFISPEDLSDLVIDILP